MAYNGSDTSLRSLHTAVKTFRSSRSQRVECQHLNGTSVVECSILKLSNTNVILDTAQTSICIGIDGKLETLTTHRRLVCVMYSGL